MKWGYLELEDLERCTGGSFDTGSRFYLIDVDM